jgi:hypothetical protein
MRENLYPTGVGNDEHEVEGWAEAERDLRKAVAEPATTTTAVPLVDAGESEAEIRADIVADAAADRMNELEDALVGALSLLGATVRADPDLVSLRKSARSSSGNSSTRRLGWMGYRENPRRLRVFDGTAIVTPGFRALRASKHSSMRTKRSAKNTGSSSATRTVTAALRFIIFR